MATIYQDAQGRSVYDSGGQVIDAKSGAILGPATTVQPPILPTAPQAAPGASPSTTPTAPAPGTSLVTFKDTLDQALNLASQKRNALSLSIGAPLQGKVDANSFSSILDSLNDASNKYVNNQFGQTVKDYLAPSKPIEVSPGATLYDTKSGKALYTAPAKSAGSGTSPVNVVSKPALQDDVDAVLSGRNTLYNIRQTMGRTNAAQTYMQQMRSAITKIDPNFDFVASDAGGKAVSQAYFQKSLAAIDTVLPNIDTVTNLSNQVDRVGIAGVDELLQRGQVQIGNKKVANFRQAQKLIADEIGLALGGGALSDMKLQLGFDITDPSLSQEAFASNMGLVKDFVNNRRKALTDLRYKSSTVGGAAGSASASAGRIRVQLQNGQTGTIDSADFDAKTMTKI